MTVLYLIRHGLTASNSAGVFQGRRDMPLSERGAEQARLLGRRFAGVPLDALYCSALSRARQTAEEIAQHTGLEPVPLEGLNEIDMGEMAGHTIEECKLLYPAAAAALEENPAEFSAPGGESARQVYARAVRTIEALAAQNPGKTLAAVSHGFVIQAFLNYIETLSPEPRGLKRFIVGNTAVNKLIFEPQRPPRAEYVNDQSHLPPEWR